MDYKTDILDVDKRIRSIARMAGFEKQKKHLFL